MLRCTPWLTAGAMAALLAWPHVVLSHGPHPATSGVVGLDVHAQGAVVDLLWAEKGARGALLRHQRSADGGATWSEARLIATGAAGIASPRRGNDPQVAARGERVVAVWSAPGTSRFGGGPLATALSDDGGRTWRAGPAPADDGSTASHGFADLAADAAGALHLVWLDPRDGAQGLRASVSRDFGASWQPNVTVDGRTCECCLNRLLAGAAETAVIYRDKGPRDMAVALTADGGRTWTRAGVAGAFGWEFEGCPEVGGALAALERQGRPELHALVWTGQEARAGIHHLRSTDRGRTWNGEARLGGEGARHLDLAASSSGRLAAVWDETNPQGATIQASVSDDGVTWRARDALSIPGVRGSHPQVVATAPGRFLAVWTEAGPGGAVVWRAKPIASVVLQKFVSTESDEAPGPQGARSAHIGDM